MRSCNVTQSLFLPTTLFLRHKFLVDLRNILDSVPDRALVGLQILVDFHVV